MSNLFRVAVGVSTVGFIMDNKTIQLSGAFVAMLSPYLEPTLELGVMMIGDVKLMMVPMRQIIEAVGKMIRVAGDVVEDVSDDITAVEKFFGALF